MTTEIDAKAKMKERMAKMRAAKGKKAAPAPKQKDAIAKTKPPEGQEFKTSSTAEPGPIRVREEQPLALPQIKEWAITDFADLCKVPEEHLDYFFVAMRIEIRKAIRAKKSINNFVFTEQHKLSTYVKSEDVFE